MELIKVQTAPMNVLMATVRSLMFAGVRCMCLNVYSPERNVSTVIDQDRRMDLT
jgi:hypothetical protein